MTQETVKITFVLYATNYEYVKRTYRSMKKQDLSDVKLVLVTDEKEQQLSSDLRELMGEQPLYLSVGAAEGLRLIKEHLDGFVFFLREGMRFEGGCVARIKAALAHIGQDCSSVLVPVTVDKKNPQSLEYDEYVKAKAAQRSLEQDFCLLHQFYFAHGIRAHALMWDNPGADTGVQEDMELSIIRLVAVSVCRAARLRVIHGTGMWIEGFREMAKTINKYMESYEGIAAFGEVFFSPLYRQMKALDLAGTKNGQYLLLYYCNRVLSTITQIEKKGVARPAGIEQIYVDALLALPDFEVMSMHPYMAVSFKYAILRSYFPALKDQSGAAERILEPQYRYISLYEIKPQEETLYLEFSFMKMEDEQYELFCIVNGEAYPCSRKCFFRENDFLERKVGETDIYTVQVPRETNMDVSFARREKDRLIPFTVIMFQKTTPLSNKVFLYKKLRGQYYYSDAPRSILYVRRAGLGRRTLLCAKRFNSLLTFEKAGLKAIAARILCHIQNLFARREVWLLADRPNRADDNGEVMFQYLSGLKEKRRDIYFVIDRGTDDESRMQKYGKTVAPFSWKHKMLYLRNTVTMSSQANKMVTNPFGLLDHLYRDMMYDKRLVFLQHGVTKDNQSAWLNKYNRNLYGFVVNTKAEYDSVFTYDYFYTPERVWLTGMPRFDRLYHDEKNYVTIMPTWRKSLSKGTDDNGVWQLDDDFKKSAYFQFYNSLLGSDRLKEAADRLGYTICFMPHPNTISGMKYFRHPEGVLFFDMTKSYREVFAQTNLMVTDYSSVAFDFAYLRKPVIYAQFDREDFFSGAHSYTEGYFDYDRDGFGQVTLQLEETVDAIIDSMEKGCVLDPLYRQRIDDTFAFDDQNCCQRVLERFEKERRSGL